MQKSKNIYKKTKEIKSKYGQKKVQKTHTFDLTNAKVVLKCTSKSSQKSGLKNSPCVKNTKTKSTLNVCWFGVLCFWFNGLI